MTTRRCRRLAGSPLGDDDLLAEILLRLPSLPSSLLRVSLVCKRWRSIVSDPHFLRRFRDHHREPPLLGFFTTHNNDLNIVFTPTLDPPDKIPAERFSLRLDDARDCKILGCRHGRVLVLNRKLLYFLVWDPITNDQRREAFPAAFRGKDQTYVKDGAVICAAGEQGHVHGDCHSSPFQVILLGQNFKGVSACLYSSVTGTWGNVVSLLWPQNVRDVDADCPSTLVGNSFCWLLTGRKFAILEFDLRRQNLSYIEIPSNVADLCTIICYDENYLIVPADGGGLNLVVLSAYRARVWKWKADCDSVAGWVLINTIDFTSLLSLRPGLNTMPPKMLGLADHDNAMHLWTDVGVFSVHVESMQFKKLFKLSYSFQSYHPFTSFYFTGHIAEATHNISTLNPAGSTERTISSVVRSERATSGIGKHTNNMDLQIQITDQSVEEVPRNLFGVCAAKAKDDIVLSNAGNDCDKLTRHVFEIEVGKNIEGVHEAHSERSRSKRPVENGNSSNSAIPPTPGAKKDKSIIVETIEAYTECKKHQHIPLREFSVAKCITAMCEIVDVSDEEKVLACDLFRDDVNREIFLSLDATLRTMWLKKQLIKFC